MFNIKTKRVLSVVLLTLFVVSLTASAVSASITVYSPAVTSTSGAPTAKFFAYIPNQKSPAWVEFWDQSTGGYWKWWSFGDGTGTDRRYNEVSHTYKKPGTYRVSLKETNFLGTKSSTTYLTVKIT